MNDLQKLKLMQVWFITFDKNDYIDFIVFFHTYVFLQYDFRKKQYSFCGHDSHHSPVLYTKDGKGELEEIACYFAWIRNVISLSLK